MSKLSLLALPLLASSLLHCSSDVTDEFAGDDSALMKGGFSAVHPEVGLLVVTEPGKSLASSCTATLISNNFLLSAAHCFEGVSNQWSGQFYLPGSKTPYELSEFVHWGNEYFGAYDVVIAELRTLVPPSVAKPALLSGAKPKKGESVTIVGYGCQRTDCSDYANASVDQSLKRKQSYVYAYGAAKDPLVAHGDSGGPTFDASGAIFQVTSGSSTKTYSNGKVETSNVFGDVVALRSKIVAHINAVNAQ